MRSLALARCHTVFGFLCSVATLLQSTLFLNVFPVTVMSFLLWLYLSGSCTDRKGTSKWIINKTNYGRHLFLKPESKWGFFHWAGMRSSVPLADSEDEWGERPSRDLLCSRPELQRLRRVLAMQDQWVTLQPCLEMFPSTCCSFHPLLPLFSASAIRINRKLTTSRQPVRHHDITWRIQSAYFSF